MFRRIRTIKGRRYLYEEERYRENGKVRSRSRSLGPVDGPGSSRIGSLFFVSEPGSAFIDREIERGQKEEAARNAQASEAKQSSSGPSHSPPGATEGEGGRSE